MIDDDLEYEGQENIETQFSTDHENINETRKSIIYGLYSQLNPFANFFGHIEHHYKKVAFTWLVSSFVAIEYLFSYEATNMPINPILALVFVSFLAIFGIILIWFLDVMVYQTYFYSVILEEAKLEKKYKWLPKINFNFGAAQYKEKKYSVSSFFYIGCNTILLFIMCLSMFKIVKYNIFYSILIALSFVIFWCVVSYVMFRLEFPEKKPVAVRKFFKKNIRLHKK